MFILYKHQIQSLIIEGGQQTLQTFIDSDLCDEAFVYMSNKIHFSAGTKAPILKKNITFFSSTQIKTDTLRIYKND